MHSQNVNDMTLVRRIVGFAKIGVAVQTALVRTAQEKFAGLVERGVLPAEDTAQTASVLRNLGSGILPSAETCRAAMLEVNQHLLPLRQEERAAESMRVTPNMPRERA
jgi:hypothetical protein